MDLLLMVINPKKPSLSIHKEGLVAAEPELTLKHNNGPSKDPTATLDPGGHGSQPGA